MPHVNGA
ncbi:putative membrane protein, partial [Yersinia pestis PY-29]